MAEPLGARPVLGIVPYLVAGCMFMENLDATVIVTALPTIAGSFGVAPASLTAGITIYMVAVAIFLPLNSWIADRIGSRTLMCGAIVAFTLASLLCGTARGLDGFIAARALQGAAAALMSPSGRAVVLRGAPKVHLVHIVAVLTWPSLIAPVLGPPIGGFLATYASWRWIFFLNVPIGVAGLALVIRYFPQQRGAQRAPLDIGGVVLGGATLGALIVGLEWLGAWGPRAGQGLALAAAGLVLGVVTIRHLLRTPHPLVSLAPARVPSFMASALTGGSLTRIAIGATPFLIPLLFQTVLGYSAFAAGAMTLVYFAGNLGMKLFTTGLLARFGFRAILIVNGLAVALAVAACAGAVAGLPWPAVVAILLIGGATRSLQFTALNTLAFAEIPPADVGAANTLNSLVQQVAMTLGVSIAALVLHAGAGAAPAGADFARAFLVVAAIGLAGVPCYARLAASSGSDVSGRSAESDPPARPRARGA